MYICMVEFYGVILTQLVVLIIKTVYYYKDDDEIIEKYHIFENFDSSFDIIKNTVLFKRNQQMNFTYNFIIKIIIIIN